MGATNVLLFVPNIIGYIRIGLLLACTIFYHHPSIFIGLYVLSSLLDGIDGYFARRLNQVSLFGSWLDVLIDVASRSMLWCNLYHWGFLVSTVEWLTFVCTHSLGNAQWKNVQSATATPVMIQKIMENNFRTPLGVYAVISLFGLPVWLYAHYTSFLSRQLGVPAFLQYAGIGLLSGGRAVCFIAEVWFIFCHIQRLVNCHGAKQQGKESTAGDRSSSTCM